MSAPPSPNPSLVRRLVLWQSAALTVSLGVLSVSLFLIAAHRLRRHHDDDLRSQCLEAGEVLASLDERVLADDERRNGAFASVGPNVRVTPLAPPARGEAPELGRITLGTHPRPHPGSAAEEESPQHEGSTLMRVASGVFQAANGERYAVQVSENLGDLSPTLRSLQVVILTFAPLILLLSIGVGAWIIHGKLRPLRSVVRAASSMDANQLNDRIQVEGGSSEVTQLINSFNQMIERLALSFERVGEFTANASHELRTPLTALTSSLEVALGKERSADEYRRIMTEALDDVRHLTRIVENLLVMAQTDTGRVQLKTGPLDLGALLADSIEAVLLRGADADVVIEVDDSTACMVEGDPHWLRQLFDNLIDNAVKYASPGGTVRISTATRGDVIEIAVTDNGIGIAEEDLSRVFDRYHRGGSAQRDGTPGVGLGLSIAEWVAGAHHGRIEIESAVGRGSRFTVVLPRKSA